MSQGITNNSNVTQSYSPPANNAQQLSSDNTSSRHLFSNTSKNNSKLSGEGQSDAQDVVALSIGVLLNQVSSDLVPENKHEKVDVTSTIDKIEQDIQKINVNLDQASSNPSKGGMGDAQQEKISALVDQIQQDIESVTENVESGDPIEVSSDDSFLLSLISSLLEMLGNLTSNGNNGGGSNPSPQPMTGSPLYTPELVEAFNSLIEFLGVFGDAMEDKGSTRAGDVISMFDQQLEEKRYRSRESRSMITQEEYKDRRR